MSDTAPVPVHLKAALRGVAENPALPAAFAHRMVAFRSTFGSVAVRADLSAELIEEIIATGDEWFLHALALNRWVPESVRMRLAAHPDSAVRAALVTGCREAPARDLLARLLGDPDKRVRERMAKADHVPTDLRARLAHDPEPEVRAALARWWPKAPEQVRRVLLTDPAPAVRAAACATYYAALPHPVHPADLVPALLDDPATRVGAVNGWDGHDPPVNSGNAVRILRRMVHL